MPEIKIRFDEKTSRNISTLKFYNKYLKYLYIIIISIILIYILLNLFCNTNITKIQCGFIGIMFLTLLYLSGCIARILFNFRLNVKTIAIFSIVNLMLFSMIFMNILAPTKDTIILDLQYSIPIFNIGEYIVISVYCYILNVKTSTIQNKLIKDATKQWEMKERNRQAQKRASGTIKKEHYKSTESVNKKSENINNETMTVSNLFAGIKTEEELKKRYRDLSKIYHPDNQAGDETMLKLINQEYTHMKKQMNL